ncbi:MAG: polysaccharide deacetylase family protein [Deltaproteobacteria bacterium]|nr:polysaccharide deacetylase family protein [Deltaproteobacteria bacterium]
MENVHEGSDEGAALPPIPVNQGFAPHGLRDITRVATEEMSLSVTFDGGSDADEAGAILDALKERGIRTTFFLTGIFIKRHPDMVRRIVADGHEVGNHTMNHPHLTDYAATLSHKRLSWVDRGFLRDEINGAANAFKEAAGAEMAPLWRAPFGEVNREIIGWARDEGYLHIGWTADTQSRQSLDTLDWVADKGSRLYHSSREIKERLLNFGTHSNGLKGGIILMHLSTERKTDKLSSILGDVLDGLSEKGYRFVKVSKLIQQDKGLKRLASGAEEVP